jgi:hypothetical protein
MPIFNQASLQFHFRVKPGKTRDELIFAKKDQIIVINFETEQVRQLYKYKDPLTRQPSYFQMNENQNIIVISTIEDSIYLNLSDPNKQIEVDIDVLYSIGQICEIAFDKVSGWFYILCNVYQDKLGVYILGFHELDLQKVRFLMRDSNKLDIWDANIVINRRNDASSELVLSFKTIYINTFTIMCLDIDETVKKSLIFRHESFQLWESEVRGILLESSKDFISVNKDGINVVALGSIPHRPVVDSQGIDRMLHSLESMNFLKVDEDNHLNFAS